MRSCKFAYNFITQIRPILTLQAFIELKIEDHGYKNSKKKTEKSFRKENSPQYFCSLNPDEELSLQYEVLSSLDVVVEKLTATNKRRNASRESYLGLLNSLDTHDIYGYVTSTKIKFIIVVDSTNMSLKEDNEIRSMFGKLHSTYVDIVYNPFYVPGEAIGSKSFDVNVKNIMAGTI